MVSLFLKFLDHKQSRTTVGRTPPDEWSARRRDVYLTTHNIQTSMPLAGFEPMISAEERPQNYALDSAATGTGINKEHPLKSCNSEINKVTSLPIGNAEKGESYFINNPSTCVCAGAITDTFSKEQLPTVRNRSTSTEILSAWQRSTDCKVSTPLTT